MAAASGEVVIVPRSFKLLDEHDASIGKMGKSYITGEHANYIQYGIVDESKDADPLRWWRGMIFGIQGKHCGEVFYNFIVDVPSNYPQAPPIVRILGPKMKMNCLDQQGYVHLDQISPRFRWQHTHNIADVLVAVRENMKQGTVSKDSAPLQGQAYAEGLEPWK